MTTSPSRRRLLACVLATLVVVLPALGAGADSRAAADWIASELDAPEPDFDQFGRTAARTDVIFALASAGARPGSARQALGELEEGAGEYVGPPDSPNAGAVAKVILALAANRHAPDSLLAGRDLEAELRALQAGDGRFADDVFSHSLAVQALATTGAGVPSHAVDWLVSRQNDDGSFSSQFDPASPDYDVTSLALQALVAAGAEQPASAAADFLAGEQNPDGSWPSPFGDPNANTAGVAGQALRAAGSTDAADLAAEFVLSLQTGDGGIRLTAAETDANGFATLQGVLALGGPAYHELDVAPFGDVAWEDLFAVEVDWLADSGITRGCDPPHNDRFCPGDPVTRGQMAAFLHRALGDEPASGEEPEFTDTAGTVFAEDIAWLADSGITRGCNPPHNDRYCPGDPVTRGQMAAFLHRALGD